VALALLLELDERPGQHELRDRVARREPHGLLLAGQAAHERLDRLGLGQQLARLDVQPRAGVGERDAARRALEQARASQRLERAQTLGQRRLRHAQQARRAAQAAQVGRRAERAQLGHVSHAHRTAHNPRIGRAAGAKAQRVSRLRCRARPR
jgi:hypothetical protein